MGATLLVALRKVCSVSATRCGQNRAVGLAAQRIYTCFFTLVCLRMIQDATPCATTWRAQQPTAQCAASVRQADRLPEAGRKDGIHAGPCGCQWGVKESHIRMFQSATMETESTATRPHPARGADHHVDAHGTPKRANAGSAEI